MGPGGERGFSRIEWLLAFFLVGLLGSLSVPWVDARIDRKNTSECRMNLTEIQAGLIRYLIEHENRLPDLIAGRTDAGQEVPVMETVLIDYVEGPEVFHCPADGRGLYERSGSSYYWNYFPKVGADGKKALQVTDPDFRVVRPRMGSWIELVTDKEPFHKQKTFKNSLYLLEEPTF